MVKKPDLPNLSIKRRNGREYVFFRKYAMGQETYISLPHYSDPGFLDAYIEANKGKRRKAPKFTFKKLIEAYQKSDKFRGLKPRTKRDYNAVNEYLLGIVGADDPARMIRRDVVEAMEANTHRKRFANEIKAHLSRLFEFGINQGWLEKNPAKGVEGFKTGPGHKPWPQALVDRYRAAATGVDLLLFELAIGTGQRKGDILKMRWSDIEDGGINVTQSKTGHELWIPFTPRLASVLESTPKAGLWIITSTNGKQMPEGTIDQRFRAVRKAVGGEGYVIHGLRYTAAHELAAAGCTDAQIAAITGHKSVEMVAKYSRKVGQKVLARKAQEKRK